MSKFDPFTSIQAEVLDTVAGAKASSDPQLETLLTSISSSIKDLASNKNNNGNDQMTQMMFMMIAMGGLGGGGGGVSAVAPAPVNQTIVKVNVRGRRGRKGW
jgi:hypothetical protein